MDHDADEFPDDRGPKRRKLNEPSRHFQYSEGSSTHSSDESPSKISEHGSEASGENNGEQEKPKSKHRIHVPKNGEIPKDAFYTQPPQRDSSPYRIEPFCWHKPKQVTPAPVKEGRARFEPAARTKPPSSHRDREADHVTVRRNDSNPKATDIDKSPRPHKTSDEAFEDVLADLPSDAFSSPEGRPTGALYDPIAISPQSHSIPNENISTQAHQVLIAPLNNLRQTTLFGQKARTEPSSSQSTKRHNWPLANREEPPTHHVLNPDALQTWIYPTNLGSIREYQYGIVAKGLYHNLLVALPTGLGKTFIAATIMLNWFRWTQDAQIVFVAPTRPLVSQQVKACFEIAGIPRAVTVMLTGNTVPGVRAEEWRSKRVFFMTPQTLINDLKSGIADPKRIILLVVDEAHRATGGYAYVEVVKFLNRFNTSFRVLALTATPGASVESVQEVIDGLGISRIEIRTEESLDIRQYVHARKIDTMLFDYSEEIVMVMELFAKALQPLLNQLNGMNAYWAKDPMVLTPYGCNLASRAWMGSDAGRKANPGTKGMVLKIFALLASLSHGTELLKFHGIGPFFRKVLSFRDGAKSGKYDQQVVQSEHFQKMMTRLRAWVSNPDFVGHPKLVYLQSVAMNHFLDAGDGRGATDPSRTRIMVFAHYRDSAEEIARVLKRNEPMIRPHVFVGQANSKESEGMDQKTQLSVINKFKDGTYNTLVATSIGEEGLDIGEIDLIVCYDASASPIRMLQRMGRTGRKRAGNIVVTLMKGKEETNFTKAKDNYEKMQHEIAAGTRFSFHDESNRRMIPKSVQPVVDKTIIDIPPENTQPELPEPTRRAKAPKKPPKKFHMPDNVRTGFVNASRLGAETSEEDTTPMSTSPPRASELPQVQVPLLDEVLLTPAQEKEFERTYLDIKGDTPQIVQVPSMNAFPLLQRSLRPVSRVAHGRVTRRMVKMLSRMHEPEGPIAEGYEKALRHEDRDAGSAQAEKRAAFQNGFSGCHKDTSASTKSFHDATTHTMSDMERVRDHVMAPKESTLDLRSDEEASEETLGEEPLGILRVTSSTFSPPSSANTRQPFYLSQSKKHTVDSDSGEDLPDFGALMGKPGSAAAAAPVLSPSKARKGGASARRKARRVIEDDSDEE